MLLLSKLLPIFVFPLGLTISLLLVSVLCAALRLRRVAICTASFATILLWISSTPIVANWAEASLERQYPPKALADTADADAAIILGGALGQPLPPRVDAGLSEASDRILHAARLYRAGKVKLILVSAGNLPWLPAVRPEAELIEELLVEWGVPQEAIELGRASRNTYENAQEIKQIWERRGLKSALLVTSASHMPRAIAVLRRAGLAVTASTADVQILDADTSDSLFAWLPDASALATTTKAAKEWIGLVSYRLLGYA